MSTLDRNIGDTFSVTAEVEVTILSVQGNQVKLGINAPRHIDVHREEVYKRIKQSGVGRSRGR